MTAKKSKSKPGSAKSAQVKTRRAAASSAPAKARAAKQAAPAKTRPAKRAASRPQPATTRKTPGAKPALPRKATAKPVATSQARKAKAAVKPPRSAASRLKSKPVSKNPSHVTTPSKNKTQAPSAMKAAALKSGGKAVHETNAKAKPKPAAPHKKPTPVKGESFTRAELEGFYQTMQEMRKRLLLQVSELRQQSLLRHDEVNQDEDGTDAFQRVTSLDRASVEQAEIVQINAALMAIKEGTYGLCESCRSKIERSRLKALPFAKTCIKCQSAMEDQNSRRRSTHDLWD
jgi:DnaK suppressor protein